MNIGKYLQMYSEDLKLKNYSDSTIENYVCQVGSFLNHFNSVVTKPSEINERQIKTWLMEAKTINSRKHRISAVKLFYHLTGKQPLKFKHIEYPRSEKKLPIVLSQSEVQRMFDVCDNLKHKTILAMLYSCGLRVSELINLKWSHIDRSRMIINVIAGKGKKDRQVPLSPPIIPLLEKYFTEYRSRVFVFNGWKDEPQYSPRSVGLVMQQLADKTKIGKRVYTHLMRHNCFTHMVENGIDINLIQRIAGHNNVKTTMMYCHISNNIISKIQSPLASITL